MNNQDILFAGLMGSRAIETLGVLDTVQNELTKHVLPVIPFLPFKNTVSIAENTNTVNASLWEANKPLTEGKQYFPLSFSFEEHGLKWLFPYEPLISITGKNIIVKRKVLKGTNGTIKEHWNSDDYNITITGALFGEQESGKYDDCFPRELMRELFSFLSQAKFIYVFSPLLELLDIHRIVIDDYSFPFTKGENVQADTLNASSDISHNALIHPILQAIH
jgi:hypothetical protein